jgi:predicted transcriptional regulator
MGVPIEYPIELWYPLYRETDVSEVLSAISTHPEELPTKTEILAVTTLSSQQLHSLIDILVEVNLITICEHSQTSEQFYGLTAESKQFLTDFQGSVGSELLTSLYLQTDFQDYIQEKADLERPTHPPSNTSYEQRPEASDTSRWNNAVESVTRHIHIEVFFENELFCGKISELNPQKNLIRRIIQKPTFKIPENYHTPIRSDTPQDAYWTENRFTITESDSYYIEWDSFSETMVQGTMYRSNEFGEFELGGFSFINSE